MTPKSAIQIMWVFNIQTMRVTVLLRSTALMKRPLWQLARTWKTVTQDASAVFIAVNFFYFVFHVSFVHLFAQIQTFRAQQQV